MQKRSWYSPPQMIDNAIKFRQFAFPNVLYIWEDFFYFARSFIKFKTACLVCGERAS